jgi:hypothetical protein
MSLYSTVLVMRPSIKTLCCLPFSDLLIFYGLRVYLRIKSRPYLYQCVSSAFTPVDSSPKRSGIKLHAKAKNVYNRQKSQIL